MLLGLLKINLSLTFVFFHNYDKNMTFGNMDISPYWCEHVAFLPTKLGAV
jgi:hypothetical protein